MPFRHLSLVPNIETYFIFPELTARVICGNDRDGVEQWNMSLSSPLGISIQPMAFADIIVGSGFQWSSN